MRSMSVFLAALITIPLLSGCSIASEDEVETSDSALGAKLSPSQRAAIKAEVKRISERNMTRTDNWAQVRAELDPLISRLVSDFGQRPAKEKLPIVKGAWHQLWSDFPYVQSSFNNMDERQIYQVVSDRGFYYNLGDSKVLGLFGTTGVLRGAYAVDGTKLRVKFTSVGFQFGRLNKDENLVLLANRLEDKSEGYTKLPGGGKAPRGPVNIAGTLETIYVDDTMRIDRGTQDDYVDADGNVLTKGIPEPRVFVLERVTFPDK